MTGVHLDAVAVRFRPGLSLGARRGVAAECGLHAERHARLLPGEAFAVIPVAPTAEAADARHRRAVTALGRHRHVARVAPVRLAGRRYLATDRLWLGLADPDRRRLPRLPRGTRVLHTTDEGEHLIELPPRHDPEAWARRLARLASVEYAEPDYVLLGTGLLHGLKGGGPATRQYAFRVTRTVEARRIQTGSAEVIVAVIDNGVLGTHRDLSPALAPGHDPTGKGKATAPHPWDAHGTECAGLVAGAGVGRHGVQGVGAGCRIMPVRVGYSPDRYDGAVFKHSWIRAGIDWAWRHGAAVLSMSLGGGPPSRAVSRALERARTRGRGGKGCVLVAAAGNSATPGVPVEFPANLAGVLAVGATNRHDEPQARATRQEPWISNSGPAVAIAAPGVNSYTSTVPDPEEQETALYIHDFTGTSAATPLVAGAAALLLSANPELTEQQVRDALTESAAKVGSIPYHRGRNDHMGAGRLDVLGALRRVRSGARRSAP